MTQNETRARQAGFSLIELTIAMTATMVIAGAIFGLMTAGNSAFRREPGLADRQQNIRMGMDIIARDIYRTGQGIPTFAQVFANGRDAVGPMGSSGQSSDEIEMVATSDCGTKRICKIAGLVYNVQTEFTACYGFPTPVVLIDTANHDLGVFWAPEGHSDNSCGTSGAKNGMINLPPGQSDLNYPGGPGFVPDFILVGEIARYRIAVDTEGVPNLERSRTGGVDVGENTWEIIARGIEDLQVEYLNGTGWSDEPGVVSCGATCAAPTQAEYDTIVQRVRVRLSARALVVNVQGQTTAPGGPDAVRGELISEFAPKAAQTSLGIWNGEM